MPTDTKLNQLIINQLTQEQYDEAKAAGTLSDTELYITDSDDEALTNNKISNCITEIPQDIKLELNNGTLTLKAGSRVYVPNGFESDGTTPKFDKVVIESDVQLLSSLISTYSNGDYSWCYNNALNKIQGGNNVFNQIQSNTYDNSAQYCMFYDTTNNIIKYTTDSGATWETGYSLCFCLSSLKSGVGITSIDQVFNGFGYIGSTVFALPGVKGLIPNGRNADGSLKSIEFTVNKVTTYNCTMSSYFGIKLEDTEPILGIYGEQLYNSSSNTVIFNGIVYKWMYSGSLIYSNGRITSFVPKTVFHALDYNDKSTISGWSMPSSRYIDLTLGASGSTYTAPANGWVYVYMYHTDNGRGWIDIVNHTNKMEIRTGLRNFTSGIMPVLKGDVYQIGYDSTGLNNKQFRFYYAEGENS